MNLVLLWILLMMPSPPQIIGLYTANKIVGGNLPSACNPGPPADVWIDTTVTPPIAYVCGPSDIWNALGSGASVAWGSITGVPGICYTAGCTMTGSITLPTGTTSVQQLIFPPSVTATTPTSGSVWFRGADTRLHLYDGTTDQSVTTDNLLSAMPGIGIVTQTNTSSPPTLVNRTLTGTASYITVADGAGTAANPTITVAAGPVRTKTCVVTVGDPGSASPVLANDNDSPVACPNDLGVDWTITTVACYADAGSPTVTPILTGGSATSVLTGALTCGTAAWAAGTVQGTAPVVHSFSGAGATCSSTPCSIDVNITTAGGTAKYLVVKIVGTF